MEKLTPLKTVKALCRQCLKLKQFNTEKVRDCQGNTACELYPYRLDTRIPIKTFRKYCLQCQGGKSNFVDDCKTESCALWFYRSGKNIARQGIGGNLFKPAREPVKFRSRSIFDKGEALPVEFRSRSIFDR
jgi:hypothetical protein